MRAALSHSHRADRVHGALHTIIKDRVHYVRLSHTDRVHGALHILGRHQLL